MTTKRHTFDISVAIPAYSRCSELIELLQSIYNQDVLPMEITICEDMSLDRDAIREIAHTWNRRFAPEGCAVNYLENEHNLGYDGNIRNIIHVSHSRWVMLMGNDDLLLPGCISTISTYLKQHPEQRMVSRSFLMFKGNIDQVFGVSKLRSEDFLYTAQNSSPGIIFRTCGFVGGLILDREWADGLATKRYDGSLYYQIYLGATAYCESGIGYISREIVGSRAGNPPLFGSASTERDVHVPGSYTPQGRAKMWAGVLTVAEDVGTKFGIKLLPAIKEELKVRQSFHIFEMMAGSSRQRMRELRHELETLELFGHPLPCMLYSINCLLGVRSKDFYRIARVMLRKIKVIQAALAPRRCE
jgi:Glycosyl transferase family 2